MVMEFARISGVRDTSIGSPKQASPLCFRYFSIFNMGGLCLLCCKLLGCFLRMVSLRVIVVCAVFWHRDTE